MLKRYTNHIYTLVCSTLTFEGARRMVEQDLGMKRFSLDAHKKILRHCMEEVCKFCLELLFVH
jgi:hypothetical protein